MAEARIVWGALWRKTKTQFSGPSHLLNENCLPVLFRTRREARTYIEEKYGYIKTRTDLREYPHCWRLPIPVRVVVRPSTSADR